MSHQFKVQGICPIVRLNILMQENSRLFCFFLYIYFFPIFIDHFWASKMVFEPLRHKRRGRGQLVKWSDKFLHNYNKVFHPGAEYSWEPDPRERERRQWRRLHAPRPSFHDGWVSERERRSNVLLNKLELRIF